MKDVSLLRPVRCGICNSHCIGVNGGNYPICIECEDREINRRIEELINKIKFYVNNKKGDERKFLDYFMVWLETGKDMRGEAKE